MKKPKTKTIEKAKPLFCYLLGLGRRECPPLERKQGDNDGFTALEWFVANESQGLDLPTKHPRTVEKIIAGRWVKGLTKDMWIEGIREGTTSPAEVRAWAFSESDAQDVINRAAL